MAIETDDTDTTRIAAAYFGFKVLAVELKGFASTTETQLTVVKNADFLLMVFHTLRRIRDNIKARVTVIGIQKFARDQQENQSYAFDTAVVEVLVAIEAAMIEAKSIVPLDASGNLSIQKFNNVETYDFEQITPTVTAPLRALLTVIDNLIKKKVVV